ncbi:hypothetical protein CPB86DRAFT_817195 [Serendipita vermifera]|nr:hypothetical protein CPB86DRAFT_817195 [Serendipita vermifera]
MSPHNAVLDLLIPAVTDVSLSRYMAFVGSTLVVWDWLIQLGDESQTILKSKWSFPKILYYYSYPTCGIRYRKSCGSRIMKSTGLSLMKLFAPSSCRVWVVLVTVTMLSTLTATNWLFTLRLIALYRRNFFFVWFMRIFFFLTYGATFSILTSSLITYHKTVDYFSLLKVCGALKASPTFPALFYAPAAYEFFIFAFTAYRAYKDASIIRIRTKSGSNTTPFLVILYRDGLICFFVMFAVRSWNIWIWQTRPVTALNMGVNVMWGINTIMSTRVYLNLVWLTHQRDLSRNSQTTGIAFDSLTPGTGPNRLSTGPNPGWKERNGTGVEFAGMDTIDILTDYHTDLNKFTFDPTDVAVTLPSLPSSSGQRGFTRTYNGAHRV